MISTDRALGNVDVACEQGAATGCVACDRCGSHSGSLAHQVDRRGLAPVRLLLLVSCHFDPGSL